MGTKKTTQTHEDAVRNLLQQSQQAYGTTQQQRAYYDPLSYATYQQLQPQGVGILQQYLQDPMSAAMTMLGAGQAMHFIGQQGATAASQIARNLQQSGMMSNVLQPIVTQQLAQLGLQTRSGQAQALIDALSQAAALQRQAGATALGYTPLQSGMDATTGGYATGTQTGQETSTADRTQVEQTSGLGTWLPQILGLGLGFGFGGSSFAKSLFGSSQGPLGKVMFGKQ